MEAAMARVLCGLAGVGLLLIASAGASPVLGQAAAARPTQGGGGTGGAAGAGAGGSGSPATNPTTGTGSATLETTPLSAGKAPDIQVIAPAEILAAPSADSGTTECQCYRTERTPVLSGDGTQIGYADQTVPNGKSVTCCQR
jgi:hypothetical protein